MCTNTIEAQEYKSHRVTEGETVYSIAKKYGISEADIYKLNPDARNGVKLNAVLIIPGDAEASDGVTFKKHRVKRKETIFGIAMKYSVTVDDIKKYNKELYSRQLKKGERIRIPIFPKEVVSNTIETSTSDKGKHTVQAKETKYGIARKYGITVAELEAMNPMLGEGLPIGTVLNVPSEEVVESAVIEDENYEFYEVQPKEGFFRLKVKLGLSKDEIVALNPYAADGLKEGMILKIPKNPDAASGSRIVDLSEAISNYNSKRLAVMLPFQLRKADNDSIKQNIDQLKSNGAMRVALDFYSGVLMAAEFAKDKGISVEIDVYDTEGSDKRVSSIIASNDFNEVDAVIGPLLMKNVERAASDLKRTDTPIFSPLTKREVKISSNLFQTQPTEEMLEKAMLDFLKGKGEGKKVIIIADSKHVRQREVLKEIFPDAKVLSPREKGFLYAVDIQENISDQMDNWVILESSDPVIVSNVVGLLNGMPDQYTIRLFTLDKNDAYNYHDVSNMHLGKLGFTFPSVNRNYDYEEKNAFLTSYKNRFNVLPNRFAVRGFDVTYDVLLRLASADDIYDAHDSSIETEYVENKFRYSKKLFSGYQNNALYILKYTPDLKFEVLR